MPPNPNIAAIFLLWVAILSVATMGSAQPVTGAATAPGEEAATGPVTLSAVEYCAGHEYRATCVPSSTRRAGSRR